jgi:hypothetical protein
MPWHLILKTNDKVKPLKNKSKESYGLLTKHNTWQCLLLNGRQHGINKD